MPIPSRPLLFVIRLVTLLVLLLASGCGAPTAAPTVVPPAAATPESPTAAPVPVEPSPTADTPRVILVAPGGGGGLGQAAKTVLDELAAKDGLAVVPVEALNPGDLTPALRVVVLLGAPPNLDQLLQAGAGTQFVVVAQGELAQQAPNLSLIAGRADHVAFLAGYLSALVSSDWRAAGLLPSDGPLGEGLQEAYLNGARYWCGRCIPLGPPVALFPLAASLPAGSDPNAWNAAVAELQKKVLDVVYVSPEASSPELLASLAQQGLRIIGSGAPPPEVQPQWIATIGVDPVESLRALWPDLLAGNGGQRVAARITVSEIQTRWLSAGRQRLLAEMRENLAKGLINPGTVN
jgi:basic membrane lipoprotein Med (substrate-binding protein (PBP1-ABC) superfamily)